MSHTARRCDFRDKPADYARFDEADARGLESLAELFVRSIRETSALAVGA